VAPSSGASIQHPLSRETCHIAIPNYAVGAVIGAAGANIKRIIRDSNAFVTVEPRRDDQSPSDERFVTIKGNVDACWRASYFIFEKMKLEGFCGADGDVRLRTVISIPRSAAGHVVGKGGKNVRELQRSTGSIITLPSATGGATCGQDEELGEEADGEEVEGMEEEDVGRGGGGGGGDLAGKGEVTVEVYGNFISTQSAHNRIRAMAYKTPPPQGPAAAAGRTSGAIS
jgi:insulin-like growth factor 2 mRNA-binding protein 1